MKLSDAFKKIDEEAAKARKREEQNRKDDAKRLNKLAAAIDVDGIGANVGNGWIDVKSIGDGAKTIRIACKDGDFTVPRDDAEPLKTDEVDDVLMELARQLKV